VQRSTHKIKLKKDLVLSQGVHGILAPGLADILKSQRLSTFPPENHYRLTFENLCPAHFSVQHVSRLFVEWQHSGGRNDHTLKLLPYILRQIRSLSHGAPSVKRVDCKSSRGSVQRLSRQTAMLAYLYSD
jgi:hypothetical protein